MNRGKIILNEYEYIVDVYDEDDGIEYYKNFVFLRNFNYINNIAQDTDIYIIDENLYNEYLNGQYDLIFPIPDTQYSGYTTNGVNFSDSFHKNSFYKFYGDSGKETQLKCVKVRIYHPQNKVSINGIIHVENYINGIHFHYFCQDIKDIPYYSENEMTIHHHIYSEYIEFYIPNIEYLFNHQNVIYYKEDINVVTSDKNESFIQHNVITINGIQYTPFTFFIQPYKIVKDFQYTQDGEEELHYVKEYYKLRNANMLSSYHIIIFPYSYIDTINEKYIYDENLLSSGYTIVKHTGFILVSSFQFEKSIPVIHSSFRYPFQPRYETKYGDKALYYAYKDYNDLKVSTYDDTYIECTLTIYTDIKYQHYIYKSTLKMNVDDLGITPISFKLNGILNKWVEVPQSIFCIVSFKDNYLGIEYSSNKVVLSNERLKYLIQNDNTTIQSLLESNHNTVDEMKEIKLNYNNINFINTIYCVVNQQQSPQSQNVVIQQSGQGHIIYKPIFYKVQDLQNIKLVSGITQNVGINLVNYMTKVTAFKMVIDGIEIVETGRNDIYVIFKINANDLQNTSGKYNILTQDDEYISSGNYSCN